MPESCAIRQVVVVGAGHYRWPWTDGAAESGDWPAATLLRQRRDSVALIPCQRRDQRGGESR